MAANGDGPSHLKGKADLLHGMDDKDLMKVQAMLGNGKKQRTKLFYNERDAAEVVAKNSIDPLSTVVLHSCEGGTYTVDSLCTKVSVDKCKNITLTLNAKVVTSVVELYQCENITLVCNTTVKTIQADMNTNLTINFAGEDSFQQLVWAGTRNMNLSLGSHSIVTGFDEMAALPQFAGLRADIDQFIVRMVEGKLISEKVVRLENGYPSTQREIDAFNETQEANMRKMAENLFGSDIKIPKKKDDRPKVGRNDPCPCGSGKKAKKCTCDSVQLA